CASTDYDPNFKDRTKKNKKVFVDGFSLLYSERDVTEKAEGVADLARIVRINTTNRLTGEEVNGYYVDDSAFGFNEETFSGDRMQYRHWGDTDLKPLKVIRYALDIVTAERTEAALNYQFGLVLGRNVLVNLMQQNP